MAEVQKPKKLDLPFASDAEIAHMVQQFEQCQWPYERWTHRAHFAVAATYLQHFSFEIAIERVRNYIQQYNRVCGDPNGYHETITLLFMRRVNSYLERQDSGTSLTVVVDLLAQECNKQWLMKYYSEDRIWSSEAKQNWLEPDLRLLDF